MTQLPEIPLPAARRVQPPEVNVTEAEAVVRRWEKARERVLTLEARIVDYDQRVTNAKAELAQSKRDEVDSWQAVVALRSEKQ